MEADGALKGLSAASASASPSGQGQGSGGRRHGEAVQYVVTPDTLEMDGDCGRSGLRRRKSSSTEVRESKAPPSPLGEC